jgi:hypothetical protein
MAVQINESWRHHQSVGIDDGMSLAPAEITYFDDLSIGDSEIAFTCSRPRTVDD